ncbi:MAG: hypothetical protein KC503_40700 [Myxococcales bacterium]|nr:hypothetical protein [Myxococcales bacterium]
MQKEGRAPARHPLARAVRWIAVNTIEMPDKTLTIVNGDEATLRALKDETARPKLLARLGAPAVDVSLVTAGQKARLRADAKMDAALRAQGSALDNMKGGRVGAPAKVILAATGALVAALKGLAIWAKAHARKALDGHIHAALHAGGFVGADAPADSVLYLVFRTRGGLKKDAKGLEHSAATVALDMRLVRGGKPDLWAGRRYLTRAYPTNAVPSATRGFRRDPKQTKRPGMGVRLLMRAAATGIARALDATR